MDYTTIIPFKALIYCMQRIIFTILSEGKLNEYEATGGIVLKEVALKGKLCIERTISLGKITAKSINNKEHIHTSVVVINFN